MCVSQFDKLPSDIWSIIYDYKKDLEEREKWQNKMKSVVLEELKETDAEQGWCVIGELYYDYRELYSEWRTNSIYFDPVRLTEIVEELYTFYQENREHIIKYIYPEYQHCACSKINYRYRPRIDQMFDNEMCGSITWCNRQKPYEISTNTNSSCWCHYNGSCYCMYVCEIIYNLEFKLLWNSRW